MNNEQDDVFNQVLRDDLKSDVFGQNTSAAKPEVVDLTVHIWIKQRGRKYITTITNLPSERVEGGLDVWTKALKKKMACNGCVKTDDESKEKIVEFSGDQRDNVRKELIEKNIIEAKDINVHGF